MLTGLTTLNADEYWICCTIKTNTCNAPQDLFSSCSYLIRESWLRVWLWLVTIISVTFNCIVLMSSVRRSKRLNLHDFILRHLAFSDIVYGISVFIVVVHDNIYGEHYSLVDRVWRRSISCLISAILSSTSLLMSSVCLLALAIMRYRDITQLTQRGESHQKSRKYGFLVTWACLISLVICTAIYKDTDGGYVIQSNSLCVLTILEADTTFDLLTGYVLITDVHLIIATLLICIFCVKLYRFVQQTRQAVKGQSSRKTSDKSLFNLVVNYRQK